MPNYIKRFKEAFKLLKEAKLKRFPNIKLFFYSLKLAKRNKVIAPLK